MTVISPCPIFFPEKLGVFHYLLFSVYFKDTGAGKYIQHLIHYILLRKYNLEHYMAATEFTESTERGVWDGKSISVFSVLSVVESYKKQICFSIVINPIYEDGSYPDNFSLFFSDSI